LAREKQKAAHQAASLGLPDPSLVALANSANPYATLDEEANESLDEDSEDEDDDVGGVSSSLKLHAKSLKEVIGKSDIIVQVLDARDPEGTRSRKIEREVVQVHGKKLVLVLNKIGGLHSQFMGVRVSD
jgi:nuclear GTP-binding protein